MNISNYHCLPEKTEPCCTKTKKTPLTQTTSQKTDIALYEMQPNGSSPLHSHKAQHTLFVIDGEGAVFDGEKLTPIHADDVVTIISGEPHQVRNIGKKPLRFLAVTSNAEP